MTLYFKALLVLAIMPFIAKILWLGLVGALMVTGVELPPTMHIEVDYFSMASFLFALAGLVVAILSDFITYLMGGPFFAAPIYRFNYLVATDPNEQSWSNTIHGNRHHRIIALEKGISPCGLVAFAFYAGKHQIQWMKADTK